MKTFKVTYKEVLYHEFYVEAESEDDVEDEFVLKTVYNIKSNDLKKIKEVIDYNKDIIIKHWIKYFGKED